MVAGGKKNLFIFVPDGESEHTVQSFGYFISPFFVAVQDDFGVSVGL